MDKFLDLIFKTDDERKKAIYLLLTLTLSSVIASKIYGRFFGSFQIIPLTEYKKIVSDFFLTGRFVVCISLVIFIHLLLFSFVDYFFYKWLAKKADKLYDFFKNNFSKEDIIEDLKTSSFLQMIFNWSTSNLKYISVLDKDENGYKPGINFYSFLNYFRKLNDVNEKEHIDVSLSYYPLVITVQLLALFDFVVIDHMSISYIAILIVNLVTILVFFLELIVCFINVFADLKKDKILKVLEVFVKENTSSQQ